MLKALGLMPSTAQIRVNYLISLVDESCFICIWTAFTIEVSLLCALGAAVGYRELCRQWAVQVPTCSISSLVCVPMGNKCPSLRVSSKCITVGELEANRALSSALAEEELRDVGTLPAGLSAFRSHPAVHLPVERRRL
jgi:hypothetical protein